MAKGWNRKVILRARIRGKLIKVWDCMRIHPRRQTRDAFASPCVFRPLSKGVGRIAQSVRPSTLTVIYLPSRGHDGYRTRFQHRTVSILCPITLFALRLRMRLWVYPTARSLILPYWQEQPDAPLMLYWVTNSTDMLFQGLLSLLIRLRRRCDLKS